MEHIPAGEDLYFILSEIWRVCKNRARVKIITPHSNCQLAFFPDHLSFWNEEVLYAIVDDPFQRQKGHQYNFNILNFDHVVYELRATLEVVKMKYFICDDVNEKEFYKLEQLKEKYPNFKVTCFVLGVDAGSYLKKDWVEVGCHGWKHTYPPECERENQREYIVKGLEALKAYLPEKIGFRAPGFQLIANSYGILKDLGFHYIAHQNRIQSFNGIFKQGNIVNTHIYDNLLTKVSDGDFNFISEGFNKYNHTYKV
jgi:hypothetical protein